MEYNGAVATTTDDKKISMGATFKTVIVLFYLVQLFSLSKFGKLCNTKCNFVPSDQYR